MNRRDLFRWLLNSVFLITGFAIGRASTRTDIVIDAQPVPEPIAGHGGIIVYGFAVNGEYQKLDPPVYVPPGDKLTLKTFDQTTRVDTVAIDLF